MCLDPLRGRNRQHLELSATDRAGEAIDDRGYPAAQHVAHSRRASRVKHIGELRSGAYA